MSTKSNLTVKIRPTALMTVISLLGCIATAARVSGAEREVRPKPALVIQILIEGLDADCIETLRPTLGTDGLLRIVDNATTVADGLNYGFGIDATAAVAILATGTSPSVNTVDGATVWHRPTRSVRPVLADSALSAGHPQAVYSPARVAVTTLADELAIAEGGIAKVYSIAADPQIAIIMAGHSGNNAFWISDANGNWTSSPYYTDTPTSVSRRNFTSSAASRLDTLKWVPLLDPSAYPGIPAYKQPYPFRHLFQRNNPDRFSAYKVSAPGNCEVTTMALGIMADTRLGLGDATDMVNIAYTLSPYPFSKDADSRLETLDAYLRLDRDIARLIQAVEANGPGMDRTLIVVAGLPSSTTGKRDEERFRVPSGSFDVRRARSLLNMYMMALYGDGDWIAGYHRRQFHLNRDLISKRNLELVDVRRNAAEFLTRMAGVTRAFTIDDLLARTLGVQSEELLANTDIASTGDILIDIKPGWEIVDTDNTPSNQRRPQVTRLANTPSPLYILAPSFAPTLIEDVVDPRRVAPTVCRLLRIRSPNGASERPLRL